jgi:hypothetical protein
VEDDIEVIRARAARQYWAILIGWYGFAVALAALNGRFAAHPWWLSWAIFVALELVTGFASMVEDDWANDFRGDREILVRGTVANASVALLGTGLGVLLQG